MQGVDNRSGSPIPVFAVDLPDSPLLIWPHLHRPFLAGQNGSSSFQLGIPYWLLVIAAAAFGASPWCLRRFSLRTLLIATTLVAVGLGVVVMSH
jgi:hypothetical protein